MKENGPLSIVRREFEKKFLCLTTSGNQTFNRTVRATIEFVIATGRLDMGLAMLRADHASATEGIWPPSRHVMDKGPRLPR
jgi:hypothetical protein